MADRPIDASEIARNKAEAQKFEAERVRALAEADRAAAEAKVFAEEAAQEAIATATARRTEEEELAKDKHHLVYVFDQSVNEKSVKNCIQQLTTWYRSKPGQPIELQINSPGGSIFEGLALVDFLRGLREKGTQVDTVAYGMAASMGGVLLQAGETRRMGENALLLLHEGSLGAIGDFGQVEDQVKLMHKLHDRILDLFESRAIEINPRTTKRFIKKNWERTDWWLTSDEALDLGFVDEIL